PRSALLRPHAPLPAGADAARRLAGEERPRESPAAWHGRFEIQQPRARAGRHCRFARRRLADPALEAHCGRRAVGRLAAPDVEKTVSQATIYVEASFRDGHEAFFAEYSARVRAYLAKFDAKVIRRQRVTKTLYGPGRCDLAMVIDLPSMEIAERIFFEP